tara:strand:+ start:226 stop:468 length:243 start_codon:yes stop_codon:yes gene_type:complete
MKKIDDFRKIAVDLTSTTKDSQSLFNKMCEITYSVANQRVVDELKNFVKKEAKEILCDGDTYYIVYTHDFSKRIKELNRL